MKKSEKQNQCHPSQSTGQVNSIASQGWQLFHVLADETSEDREEDNNQRRIPQRDRKETHHVKKSRAQPARRAETVFPRHARERQMQPRGNPGRTKKKRRGVREYRSEPPLRASQKHTESYAEKTCDKRQIF